MIDKIEKFRKLVNEKIRDENCYYSSSFSPQESVIHYTDLWNMSLCWYYNHRDWFDEPKGMVYTATRDGWIKKIAEKWNKARLEEDRQWCFTWNHNNGKRTTLFARLKTWDNSCRLCLLSSFYLHSSFFFCFWQLTRYIISYILACSNNIRYIHT